MDKEIKLLKMADINGVSFSGSEKEIISSMEIVMTLFQIDDDAEVIAACKQKLQEGIRLLKKFNKDEAQRFDLN